MQLRRIVSAGSLAVLLSFSWSSAAAQDTEGDEPDRGAYLATIAACAYCHSPAEGPAFSGSVIERNGEQIYAPNLTPSASGLGEWSGDEIRAAITTGLTPEGDQLHPVMPYLYYNQMADTDLDALVAYLQNLEPIASEPLPANELTGVILPPIPTRDAAVAAPDPTSTVEYGGYLVNSALACGACHTPALPNGLPDPSMHLAGGTAFSGEWGTVYAGNLTPQLTNGLGSATDEDIILAIVDGQHPLEGRPLYAMPWRAYSQLTGHDVQAVLDYLRSIEPIFTEVPADQINPGYDQYVREQTGPPSFGSLLGTVFMALVLVAAVIYLTARQYRHAQQMRTTDWEEHFREVWSEARTERDAKQVSPPDEPPE